VIALLAARAAAQELPARVEQLVAELAAPTRATRQSAQLELLALPPEAEPLLAAARAPAGFEPTAALAYVRSHRPRAPKPCAIAAGTFRVGSSFPGDSNPPHDVVLAAFAIDDVEVSSFEWFRFVQGGGAPPVGWRGGRYRYGCERVPVGNVPASEAQRFAAWVGGRLPTSDEWEVAAHGGDPRPYPWGQQYEARLRSLDLANWRGEGRPPESGRDPIDRSPCGAVDFCSSLSEWVLLPGGVVAARGGNYRATKDLLRMTRAADPRLTRPRDVVGLRVVDRGRAHQ
jgi:formylglycine-generating enzyme required for sulfatase activity